MILVYRMYVGWAVFIVVMLSSFGISLHTVTYGRSNIMQGIVHGLVFATFLFLNGVL